MCIIITNVLEPGLNRLECVGGQIGSIQMVSEGALILKKCVLVGLPLKGSLTVVTDDIAEKQKNETFLSLAVLQ